MSTTININVKNQNKGLIDQLKLQQLVARTAHLEKESRIILEREASAERTTALATQGLDAQGNVLSGRLNVPAFRRDEIGASRTGSELVVGGVVFKYSSFRQSFNGGTDTINTDVTVSIGDIESSSPTVFTYPGITRTAVSSGSSTYVPGTPGGVTVWTDDPLAPSHISRTVPAASAFSTYTYSTFGRVDKSFYFVVPAGDGGAYLVLHINDSITRSTGTDTTTWTWDRQTTGCTHYLGWTYTVAYDVTETVEQIYGTPSESTVLERSQVLCYKIKNGAATIVTTPSQLVQLIEKYNPPPPYELNASAVTSSSYSLITREYLRGIACYIGTGGGTEVETGGTFTDRTYRYHDPNLDKPFGPNADLSLIKYLGGTAIGPTPRSTRQAWGPSFALAMDKADTDLTAEQSADYSYIENTVVGAKPRLYASPCTLSGTCPDASTVGWDQSLTRPSTLNGSISLDNFKANPKNTLSIPAYATVPGSGYDILFHTNWSDKNRCRQALSKLGLTP